MALLSSVHLKPGSVVLSSVTRSPIGQVSSCVWSYFYNCRLSYAYISPEFAMHGKVCIHIILKQYFTTDMVKYLSITDCER